ncbi:unnamed protein product, partial [Rotaria sp. Silwood1]
VNRFCDTYFLQLTLFDFVPSVTLILIDPFIVTFRALINRNFHCFYLFQKFF